MANQLVASSSLPPSWRYHVFLSFRGEDTRTNFTDHLYTALVGKEIKTFIDRHLLKGEEISPTLLKAIEESRISLVILSKNYADSRWCLEELVKIHQCRESKEQIILPVFYKVDPSHVRHQTGCYGAAFIDHERKFQQDKAMVLRWRRALTKVANLSGYHVKEEDYEATMISNIVEDILDRVADLRKKSKYHLQITLDSYASYEEPSRDIQRILRKNPDLVMRPISSSRFPIDPAPWKMQDGSRGSQKPSSKPVKVQARTSDSFPSVYSEIEKRLKDLEFKQSGKDLRALKQILEAMQAKGLLETKKEEQASNFGTQKDSESKCTSSNLNSKSTNQRNTSNHVVASTTRRAASSGSFESPIVIMKPAS